MTFNELKKIWQDSENRSKMTIDSDILLKEVKRNKESFESNIFWRDFREVAVEIVVLCVFLYLAFKSQDNIWIIGAYVVLAITCLYVVAFFIIDRRLQRKKQALHTDPLLGCIESSLMQVNHQMWLLKNVFWWYLLPPGVGIALFFFVAILDLLKVLPAAIVLPVCLFSTLIVIFVFWGIYWLNQNAVQKELTPRRDELEAILKNLANDNKTTQP